MAEVRIRKIQESKLLRKSRDLKPINNDSAGPPPKLFINTGTEQGNESQSPQEGESIKQQFKPKQ